MSSNELETLGTLLDKHPEWKDLPIGIYKPSGELDFVGAAGMVYEDEDEDGKILVFSPN